MVRIVTGILHQTLPFAKINPSNLTTNCGCKFLSFNKDKNGKILFSMKATCFYHTIKYYEWKIRKKPTRMKKLELTYRWNQYSDGTTGAIE